MIVNSSIKSACVREIYEHRIHVCQLALLGKPTKVFRAIDARFDPVFVDLYRIEQRLQHHESALQRWLKVNAHLEVRT